MLWVPPLSGALVHFGISVAERLVVALDLQRLHVAHIQDAEISPLHTAGPRDTTFFFPIFASFEMSFQVFSSLFKSFPCAARARQVELGAKNLLPCSVSVRCGMLTFVEALNMESAERVLHVWLLAENGELCQPQRRSFPFFSDGLLKQKLRKG